MVGTTQRTRPVHVTMYDYNLIMYMLYVPIVPSTNLITY